MQEREKKEILNQSCV